MAVQITRKSVEAYIKKNLPYLDGYEVVRRGESFQLCDKFGAVVAACKSLAAVKRKARELNGSIMCEKVNRLYPYA